MYLIVTFFVNSRITAYGMAMLLDFRRLLFRSLLRGLSGKKPRRRRIAAVLPGVLLSWRHRESLHTRNAGEIGRASCGESHRHVYGEQWIKVMKEGVNATPLPTVNTNYYIDQSS